MIDKVSGRAIYAVMSFGGFLGMGEEHYPLPWATLKYDTQKGGYVVNLDKKQLEGAPSYARGSEFEWTPDYGRKVDSFYKVPSAWGGVNFWWCLNGHRGSAGNSLGVIVFSA